MSSAAERLFWEHASDNARMSKANAKPKHRGIFRNMGPKQVLDELMKVGIIITERTLQRYVKEGLVSMPERKSAGQGKGRVSIFHENAPAEFYASWEVLKRIGFLSKKDVRLIRLLAMQKLKSKDWALMSRDRKNEDRNLTNDELILKNFQLVLSACCNLRTEEHSHLNEIFAQIDKNRKKQLEALLRIHGNLVSLWLHKYLSKILIGYGKEFSHIVSKFDEMFAYFYEVHEIPGTLTEERLELIREVYGY